MDLGLDEYPSTRHVVSYRKLGDEGFHTFLGMVGHCMKDSGEDCFEFAHHNVSFDDIIGGKLTYAKFGKVGFKNRVNLTHSHIQRAYQWAKLCMKKHLGVSFLGTSFHMCKSGQYYPHHG